MVKIGQSHIFNGIFMIEHSHFNVFDIFILAIVVISAIIGFARGFMKESLGLASWAGALYLSLQQFDWSQKLFKDLIHDEKILKIAAQGLVFAGSLVIFLCIAHVISKLVRDSFAKGIDSSLGVLFGACKSILFICIGYIGIIVFVAADKHPTVVTSSRSIVWIQKVASYMQGFLPQKWNSAYLEKALKDAGEGRKNAADLAKELSSPEPNTGKK